jgi:RNA polymerase sigma-70 factor (ECF subfamily)
MTTPSGPGPGQPDPGLAAIISERRQLINIAYRLLGSLAEAEDAVQETYARWYAQTPDQRDAIASPGAWLTTVTSRICLDQLGSARARRERYVGQWIPEPLPEPAEWNGSHPGAPALTILERTVNGQPGLIAQQDGTTVTVFAFGITGDHVTRIWAIRNPDKLRPWATG